MSKEKLKTKRGITLIALVITIVVMLILVGVTVNIALNGGLFSTTKQAATGTQYHSDREILLSAVIGARNGNAKVDFEKLNKNLPEGFKKSEDGGYTSKSGNTFYVDKKGNITDEPPKTAAQLFDAEAEKITNVNKKDDEDFTTDENLHIGDFINYTAGTWTQQEINAIQTGKKGSEVTASGDNTKLPENEIQFGGFAARDSRDGNAVPAVVTFNYAKFSNGKAITGWRLFDVDTEKNEIKLISAGCPEDFNYRW